MKDIYDFLKTFDLHTIIIVGIAFYWLNGNINQVNTQVTNLKQELSIQVTGLKQEIASQVASLQQEMAIVKTVLIMKDHA